MAEVLSKLLESFGGVEPGGSDRFTPMAEEQLQSIENKLDVRLPGLYRHYLATFGASTSKKLVEVRPVVTPPRQLTSNGRLPFATLYGIGKGDSDFYDLEGRLDTHAKLIPENMIVIGDDGDRSMYLLEIRGSGAGKIFYWDADNDPLSEEDYLQEYGRPRPPEVVLQNVHLVAESFEDFLGRLEVVGD